MNAKDYTVMLPCLFKNGTPIYPLGGNGEFEGIEYTPEIGVIANSIVSALGLKKDLIKEIERATETYEATLERKASRAQYWAEHLSLLCQALVLAETNEFTVGQHQCWFDYSD